MKGREAGCKPGSLPAFVPPCLATLKPRAPIGPEWEHEIKFDGYRIMASIAAGRVRLFTRKGLDWTERFPAIAKALAQLKVQSAYVDGEMVVRDADGVTTFRELVNDLKQERADRMEFMAFDLLHLDGADLRARPLAERKAALAKLLGGQRPRLLHVEYVGSIEGVGSDVLKAACEMKLEGIVSKRVDLPYRSGRQPAWIKAKCSASEDFKIIGYLPSNAMTDAIGALVVAIEERGKLVYAGRVGTGYTVAVAKELRRKLDALRVDKRPVAKLPAEASTRGVVWVMPALLARIDFRELSADGVLRHAVFKGLREDL